MLVISADFAEKSAQEQERVSRCRESLGFTRAAWPELLQDKERERKRRGKLGGAQNERAGARDLGETR